MKSDVDELIERLIPYDNSVKEDFLSALTPDLKKSLEIQLANNPDWAKQAKSRAFFTIVDDRWKFPKSHIFQKCICLKFVGLFRCPTVTIYYL